MILNIGFYVTFAKHIRLTWLLEWIDHVYTARMHYVKFQNRNRPAGGSEMESATRNYLIFTVLF